MRQCRTHSPTDCLEPLGPTAGLCELSHIGREKEGRCCIYATAARTRVVFARSCDERVACELSATGSLCGGRRARKRRIRAAAASELRDKAVLEEAAKLGYGRALCRREVARTGLSRDVGIPRRTYGNSKRDLIARAAKIGGIDERGAAGVDLRHEALLGAAAGMCRLKHARGRREIRRVGDAHDHHVAGGSYVDAVRLFHTAAAKVGRKDQA